MLPLFMEKRGKGFADFICTKTEDHSNYLGMTINRRLATYVILVTAVLAVMGTLLTLAWTIALTITPMACENLSIADAKFDKRLPNRDN